MYRHFAVLTLVLTAAVGFFAESENRQAAEDAAQMQHEERLGREEAAKAAEAEAASGDKAREVDTGSWGSDEGGVFGQPMIGGSAINGSWISDGAAWQPEFAAPGYSAEASGQVTRQDRDELARAMARSAMGQAGAAPSQPASRSRTVAVGNP